MGLFDKMFGGQSSEEIKFDQKDGFAAILLATIAADGNISDEEVQGFYASLKRMNLFKKQTSSEFSSMLNRLITILKKNNPEFLLSKGAEALSPDLRETAFAMVIDLILSDGLVEQDEKQFIEKAQAQLAIENSTAVKIVEVIIIKNRG